MIPFNKPYCSGRELKYIEEVCHSTTMSGNGQFTKSVIRSLRKSMGSRNVCWLHLVLTHWKCAPCCVI